MKQDRVGRIPQQFWFKNLLEGNWFAWKLNYVTLQTVISFVYHILLYIYAYALFFCNIFIRNEVQNWILSTGIFVGLIQIKFTQICAQGNGHILSLKAFAFSCQLSFYMLSASPIKWRSAGGDWLIHAELQPIHQRMLKRLLGGLQGLPDSWLSAR